MKNLWKLAAALAAIAGAIVVIVKYGNRLLEKLEKVCPCSCKVPAGEEAPEVAAAPEEAPEEAPAAEEAPAEAPEAAPEAEPAPDEVTPEDFAD